MDTKSVTLLNLKSGEEFKTDLKLSDNRFLLRGYKMYNKGLIELLEGFSNNEIKRIVNMFDRSNIDYYNIFTKSFKELTLDMNRSSRSRFKKKLINEEIIAETYCKKIMLNPFIFVPIGDKNIKNCLYLTQRLWVLLVRDYSYNVEGLSKFMDFIFKDCDEFQEIKKLYREIK